jgi:hypothetical protein
MKKTFSKKTRQVNKRTRRRTSGGGLFSWLFNRKKEPSQENIVPTYQEDTRGPYKENMAQRVQKNIGAKSDNFETDYDNDDDDAKPINEAQNFDNVGNEDDGLTDVATLGGKKRRKSKRTIKRRK